MSSEQRRFPRRQVAVEIRVRGTPPGLGRLSFDSADLSVGGAFLESEVLYDEGEGMELDVRLPAGAIKVRARIAWVRRIEPDGAAGMGVMFENLAESDRRALQHFLDRVT